MTDYRMMAKILIYSMAYGGSIKVGPPIRPLFWETHEREQQNEWMDWMDEMITKTAKEKKDGK